MTIVRTRTPSGEAIVILPEAEFERLRTLAEDALDAKTIDASQARLESGEEELLSESDLDALRAAKSPLAFWRRRRGLSLDALAERCGIGSAALAAVERGERLTDADLYRRLAAALDIDAEDLLPNPDSA